MSKPWKIVRRFINRSKVDRINKNAKLEKESWAFCKICVGKQDINSVVVTSRTQIQGAKEERKKELARTHNFQDILDH